MKKTLLVTIDFPPAYGGVANYLAGIAAHLPQDKVVILAPKAEQQEEFDRHQSYKIYRKKLISKCWLLWPKWLPTVWHLWRITRQEKVETILVGQILPVGTAAMLVKKFFGVPYFVSCHGMDILTAAAVPHKKKLMNKILKQTDGVVANSEFTKNELIKLGVPENKITVIYPCPSIKSKIKDQKSKIIEKFRLKDKKILLTVGRLVQRKGHDKVIEALPKIWKRVPNTIYVIVGHGPQISNIKYQISKLDLEKSVILTGEISDEELVAFYELCDVFVMVPRQIDGDVEGFGTVYLEANQFGKPVVAGRSGGVDEAVMDGVTGILVDSEDTSQIANVVIKLLTNQELAKKIGEQGKKRVEEKFQWEIQVKKFKKLLE